MTSRSTEADPETDGRWRVFVSSLRNSPGLPRLLAVRLASQLTDGIFQAALVGGVLFNPERHADPVAVAGGIAVLLLPYSLIGPFAGALLDHWDRRAVLLYANLIRGLLIGVVALAIARGAPDMVVLFGALAVTGASRFVSSGLSAALPHVAERDVIVATNALFTTLGGAMLSLGAVLAVGVRGMVGSDNNGSAITMLAGIAFAVIAAALAHRFARLQLGPDHPDDPGRSAAHAVAVGLLHGARAVARCRPVAAALSAIGAHRLVFGLNTLMILVWARHSGSGDGLDRVSMVIGFTAAGALLAAFVTPVAVDRIGRRPTLIAALSVGAVAELTLLSFSMPVFCAAAFVLGLIGQVTKLCGDAAMQVDIADEVRGQVFSVQDAVFNIAYVGAVAIAAFVIAPDGRSAALVGVGVGIYLVGVLVVRLLHTPPHRDHPHYRGAHPAPHPTGSDALAHDDHRRNSGASAS
ncbi:MULTISPECIES: MFS transporter [unclassified Gordonia (in: high G+C Gram-positive bacteria)]